MNSEKILKKCGLDVLGFCSPDPLTKERDYLLKRQEGVGFCSYEGQSIQERIDPTCHYSPVQTLLVFGINTKTQGVPLDKGQGLLASISRTCDYHWVLKKRGQDLAHSLGLEEEAKILVDSHPLMERAFAKRAGLGYIGKNTALIHSVFGTYLALGLILTKKQFSFDKEVDKTCGDCSLCIRACPGQALKGSGVLDPHQCLSYKSQIITEEKKNLGPRLYGCDVCQEVCPKNKGVPLSSLKQEICQGIEKEEIQDLSNRQFKKKYGHLAGAWRGKKQWLENFKFIDQYWQDKEDKE